jgi:glutamate/aspartate transport system substrate-binding protein
VAAVGGTGAIIVQFSAGKSIQLDSTLNNLSQGVRMYDEHRRLILCNDRYAVKARVSLAKLEVKLVPITPSLRVPYISSEKIDLACETMTTNLEGQKVVAFSSTYFIAASRSVSKVAANLKTLDDLKGRTVVSTIGSTNLKQISELNEQRHLGLAIVAAKDNFEAFRMLETDRAAAVVMDDILLYGTVANSAAPADYVVSDEALSIEPYGILLRPDDPAFKKVADDALATIYRNGDINRIYAKWFLNPIPPNGVDLNVPMSRELKRVIANPTDSGDPQTYTNETPRNDRASSRRPATGR